MTLEAIPLTALAHGAGCGCKLGPEQLLAIVRALPAGDDPNLLVGASTADDAAVYRLSDELALVQTVDFFTPIVDDAYDFGRIAAANALSDVYAMGGRPLTALNLVAFPLERLGTGVLQAILRGGLDVCAEAGATIVGGHSIDDPEPKYGLAVTGIVAPTELLTNAGGRHGDALVLTKPLGVGAIATAAKRGACPPALLAAAIDVMVTLNTAAAEAARAAGAHAVTDVTGFGLLGHLHSLARESGVAAEVDAVAVPAIAGVDALLSDDAAVSGGSRRNRAYADGFTRWESAVPDWRRRLLCDATTSGGLLVAAPDTTLDRLSGAVIGRLVDGPAGSLTVRSAREWPGPVPQPVFKTGEAWQPHAGKVRLLRHSVCRRCQQPPRSDTGRERALGKALAPVCSCRLGANDQCDRTRTRHGVDDGPCQATLDEICGEPSDSPPLRTPHDRRPWRSPARATESRPRGRRTHARSDASSSSIPMTCATRAKSASHASTAAPRRHATAPIMQSIMPRGVIPALRQRR